MARAVEVLCWWVLGTGVWLLTLSSISLAELSLAVPTGLGCALMAAGGRALTGGSWHPRPGWVRWLLTLPVAVVAESVTVFWVAAVQRGRRQIGAQRTVRLPADEPADVAATRRALATLALSASPGSYVIDSDPEDRVLLVHTLAGGTPAWARVDPAG